MVQNFLMNLLLAFVWVALTGHLNYVNVVFGFALGFFILWLISIRDRSNRKKYFYRVPKILEFLLYFLFDTIKANLQVAYDVITPNYYAKPGIVAYPMEAESDFEITMLANVIALSPGTLVIDVDKVNKLIYIHVMFLSDKEKFVSKMKNGLEKKLMQILR